MNQAPMAQREMLRRGTNTRSNAVKDLRNGRVLRHAALCKVTVDLRVGQPQNVGERRFLPVGQLIELTLEKPEQDTIELAHPAATPPAQPGTIEIAMCRHDGRRLHWR